MAATATIPAIDFSFYFESCKKPGISPASVIVSMFSFFNKLSFISTIIDKVPLYLVKPVKELSIILKNSLSGSRTTNRCYH